MENISTKEEYLSAVKKLKIGDAKFCREAGIHPTTIVRLKNGTHKYLNRETEGKFIKAFKRLSK